MYYFRHSLTQMYGRVDEYLLDDLPDVVLEHKVDLCRLLLQVLDVIEPGYTRIRGICFAYVHIIREKEIVQLRKDV